MKKTFFYMIGILVCSLFIAAVPSVGEEALYDNLIRFHVIANSDSEEDQSLKLSIRDAICDEFGAVFASCDSVSEESQIIVSLLDDIKKCAEDFLHSSGYDYTVSLDYSKEQYSTRTYGSFSIPAGSYMSLRITIGSGEGQNWWCVLFPQLPLSIATQGGYVTTGLTKEQYNLISGTDNVQYKLKFKTLELLERVVRR